MFIIVFVIIINVISIIINIIISTIITCHNIMNIVVADVVVTCDYSYECYLYSSIYLVSLYIYHVSPL